MHDFIRARMCTRDVIGTHSNIHRTHDDNPPRYKVETGPGCS